MTKVGIIQDLKNRKEEIKTAHQEAKAADELSEKIEKSVKFGGKILRFATGIVSEIVTEYSSQHNNISYNISSDGLTTSDQLQIYRGTCSGEDEIRVGDIVVVSGNLKKYNTTYEFDSGSTLYSLKLVAPTFYPEAGAVASGTALTRLTLPPARRCKSCSAITATTP